MALILFTRYVREKPPQEPEKTGSDTVEGIVEDNGKEQRHTSPEREEKTYPGGGGFPG